jgi:hypothetical protein
LDRRAQPSRGQTDRQDCPNADTLPPRTEPGGRRCFDSLPPASGIGLGIDEIVCNHHSQTFTGHARQENPKHCIRCQAERAQTSDAQNPSSQEGDNSLHDGDSTKCCGVSAVTCTCTLTRFGGNEVSAADQGGPHVHEGSHATRPTPDLVPKLVPDRDIQRSACLCVILHSLLQTASPVRPSTRESPFDTTGN